MYCKEENDKVFLKCENVNIETILLRDVRMFIKKDLKSEKFEIFIKNYHLNNFFNDFTLLNVFMFFKDQSIEIRKNFPIDFLFNKSKVDLINLNIQVNQIFDKIFLVEKKITKKRRTLSQMTQVLEDKINTHSFLEKKDSFSNKIL